jgi:hypothetical protein
MKGMKKGLDKGGTPSLQRGREYFYKEVEENFVSRK